jgi:oligopeptide/dipeptide ABC transporter ATP-binding protein
VSEPLLHARDLTMQYRSGSGLLGQIFGTGGRPLRAVDGIELQIGAGETVALVGESGSGKTTIGRMLTLLERPTAGRITFDGRDVIGLAGRDLQDYRRAVQMIFQNPYESLDPRLTVGQSIAEPLRLRRIGSIRERRARVEAILGEVELSPAASFIDRYPGDLSGGQLQRVAIARALVLSPRLIIADEPVSMLDVSVRAGIMTLLLRLQQSHGLSCLFITHDLAVARYMAHRIAVMYRGDIVEMGPTETLIARPAHPYTRLLIAAVPEYGAPPAPEQGRVATEDTGAAAHDIIGCRFYARCPIARESCRTVPPQWTSPATQHAARCQYATA